MYNAEKFIKETIECVQNQTETDWELLLVDDMSTDQTANIVRSFSDERIRLLEVSENAGAYAARNLGTKNASGRYLAFLDADDLWEPQKLEKELRFLEEKDAAFVFTGYEFADEFGVGTGKVVKVPATLKFKQALHNTTIFTSTVMIDLKKVDRNLCYMPNIKSEDTATWWNILRSGEIAYGLNENLVRYRRSGKTLSSNKLAAIKRIWDLLRKIAGRNVISAAWHFCLWAVLAVWRRI